MYAAVRRGLHLKGFGYAPGRPVADLAFELKLIRFRQHQLDKIRDRLAD